MPKRTSRRGLFTSRNNLFSFGRRKSKQTAGRTITSKRTELGRRLEALEDRRMLSVAPATIDLTSPTSGLEDSSTGPFITVSGNLMGTSDVERAVVLSATPFTATGGGTDFDIAAAVILEPLDYGSGTPVSLLASDGELKAGGITITQDSLIEGDEFFTFTLTESSTKLEMTQDGGSVLPNGSTISSSHTILDDDTATISISDQSFDEATGTAMVEIKLDTGGSALPGDITFDVTATDGTATDPDDYSFTTADDVKFSSGSTGGSVMVPLSIVSDRLVEGDESLTLSLSDLTTTVPGAKFGDSSATITIEDDDEVSISFSKASDTEVEPVTTAPVDVDVALTFATIGDTGPEELAGDLVVDLDLTVDTTATNVTDFFLSATSFTFDSKTESETLTITVIGDPLVEGDEIVDIDLSLDSSSPVGLLSQASIGATGNYELTIEDDDSSVLSVSTSAAKVTEGAKITYTVELTSPADLDITVPVAFSGDAVAGTDFVSPGVTDVVIKQGKLSASVEVMTLDDSIVEDDDSLTITITDPAITAISLGTDSATTTIEDDDTSKVSILAGMPTVDESAGTATYTVILSQESSTATDVVIAVDPSSTATSGPTGDFDLLPPSTLTFAAGEQIKFVTISIDDDELLEASETAVLAIDSVTSTGGLAVSKDAALSKATTTITDNDDVTISIDDVSVTEGTGGTTTATLTVSYTGEIASSVDVDFSTADNTAVDGVLDKIGDPAEVADYIAKTGTVTLPAGIDQSTTISIDIVTDGDVEPDESFFVNLSSPSNPLVKIADSEGEVTIVNDDDAILSITGASVKEGDGKATITITNTGSTSEAFDVILDTVLIPGSAVAPSDFAALSGATVSFGVGDTSQTIDVTIVDDSVVEGIESFAVQIVDVFEPGGKMIPATGVSVTTDTTSVLIDDDDATEVSISADYSEDEGDTADASDMTRVVTFSLTEEAQEDVVVEYKTTAGTADGSDYTARCIGDGDHQGWLPQRYCRDHDYS